MAVTTTVESGEQRSEVVRMCRIRNPHGVGGEPREGAWIDSDPRWCTDVTARERDRVGYSAANNGSFLMSFHDAFRVWDKVAVARPLAPTHRGARGVSTGWCHHYVHSEWCGDGAAGYAALQTLGGAGGAPQFALRVATDCELVLSLTTDSRADEGSASANRPGLMLLVAKGAPGGAACSMDADALVDPTASFAAEANRTVATNFELRASDGPFTVMAVTLGPFVGRFVLRIFTSCASTVVVAPARSAEPLIVA
jgi:hypothetical protein